MTTRRVTAGAAIALGLALVASAAAAQAVPAPRYAKSMEDELERIGAAADCTSEPNARHHCSWTHTSDTAGALTLHAVYSDDSDTIYFYVERYLELPSDDVRAQAVLRRLMELNWELLVGKFEWSPRSGEVRLSAILNTDSNFDRRAFRSIVRALDAVASRHRRELQSLLAR